MSFIINIELANNNEFLIPFFAHYAQNWTLKAILQQYYCEKGKFWIAYKDYDSN